MLHLPFLSHQSPGGLILGSLRRFPVSSPVRVTASARAAHMYVIGMSGKGKSKLLEHCLYQDIAAGRGSGSPRVPNTAPGVCAMLTRENLC